jgi:hypothetical protein
MVSLRQTLLQKAAGLPKCPGPARSAQTGPSRAPRASARPIPRSAAARPWFAARCRATAGLKAGLQAQCEPPRGGLTWRRYMGSRVGSGPEKSRVLVHRRGAQLQRREYPWTFARVVVMWWCAGGECTVHRDPCVRLGRLQVGVRGAGVGCCVKINARVVLAGQKCVLTTIHPTRTSIALTTGPTPLTNLPPFGTHERNRAEDRQPSIYYNSLTLI